MALKDSFFDRYANTGTGLSDTDVRTLRAMTHRFNLHTKEFHQYWKETKEMLKRVFQTKNDLVGVTGSIRVAFDVIISNVIEPGDRVLTLTNGYWGEYFPRVVKSYRGEPIIYTEDPRLPIDPDKVEDVLRKHDDVKAVTIVHVETDTGIANKISRISECVKKYSDALYIVDCATSLGGMEIKTDDLGIDFCFSGSHKCLSAPAGMAFITVSEKGWENIQNRKTPILGMYGNLASWNEPLRMECEPPMPALVIHAVRSTLEWILSRGLREVFRLHEVAAEALRCGLIDMGLELFPDCSKCDGCASPDKFCSDVVTTLPYPHGVDPERLETIMGERYNLSVLASPYRPGCFQLGTINELQISPDYIVKLLATLGLALSEFGVRLKLDKGIGTAHKILVERDSLNI
ncbi:MAG: pyridoxal-phosphate-dependent aminotransferase family protein [Candidatus Bathyarchaeia archaeon]